MSVVLDAGCLQIWKPKGIGVDPPSKTQKTCTLKILNNPHESMTIPVYTNTKVFEVKGLLAYRLSIDVDQLSFTIKQGSHYRKNFDHEEVARVVTISGIRSFLREKTVWPHPHIVIGAGHCGLKTAMTWLMETPQFTNFVVFDRRDRVGGTSWIQQANTKSRLQTEVGVYHLEFHENNGWPAVGTKCPWPSRDQLLDHFHEVSERFGILPYCKMNTNVVNMTVLGKEYWSQEYEFTISHDGEESMIVGSSVCYYPGNLTNPKRVIYKGEELFGGDIKYAIQNEYDYTKSDGQNVAIIGSGAFSVENVRTNVECGAKHIYMICRRKTIAMPRIVSWLINQSWQFITAALTLEACSPMYDLIGVDQWQYYAIYANETRTSVTIRQKSRFGIGDVYFLAMYYGHTEHIVSDVKRVSFHKIHLENGRVLEDIESICKLLGFNGEFEVDRLLKVKELFGWWVNKDIHRYIVAEPLGVDANNFGGTSFSPGAISWAEQQVHMLHYPKDFLALMDGAQLPTHVADESIDRPAYVVEARHGSITGITIGSLVPAIAERGAVTGPLSHQRMWEIHPIESYIEAATLEWDAWSKQIQACGYDKPHPPYPYTLEKVKEYLDKEMNHYKEQEESIKKRLG